MRIGPAEGAEGVRYGTVGAKKRVRDTTTCPYFRTPQWGQRKKLTFLPSRVNVRDPTSRNQLSPQSQQLCPRMCSKRQLFFFQTFRLLNLWSSLLEKSPYSLLRFKTRFRNLGEVLVPQDPLPHQMEVHYTHGMTSKACVGQLTCHTADGNGRFSNHITNYLTISYTIRQIHIENRLNGQLTDC